MHGRKISVSGTVSAGANGLPTSVAVTGHAATFTATGRYAVSFTTTLGKHTITAIARDVVGTTGSKSITVHVAS